MQVTTEEIKGKRGVLQSSRELVSGAGESVGMQALRSNLGSQPNLHSVLSCSVPTGCSITEAVTILGKKLQDYQKQFNVTHLLALCDYFHNTFIRHYRLYQYVLSQDQEVNLTVAHVQMCTPPQPLPLTDGKDRDVWRHEQQVAELSAAEAEKRSDVLVLKETLRMEQAQMLQKAFGVEEAPTQLQPRPTLRREVRPCPRISETQQAGTYSQASFTVCLGSEGGGPHRHLAFPTDLACTSLHSIPIQ